MTADVGSDNAPAQQLHQLSEAVSNDDEWKAKEAGASYHNSDACAMIGLADDKWREILRLNCSFPPEIFENVMLNLIRNPNITSSHLFRADILLDQHVDEAGDNGQHDILEHYKHEYKSRSLVLATWIKTRTIVRKLIPRNIQLDRPLVQTCHFLYRSNDVGVEEHLVVYLPHVDTAEDMPFYHPAVTMLAFYHAWRTSESAHVGSLALHYALFENKQLSDRLSRTGLKLLQTIHKHGQGQLVGYEKRVNLDQVIPQKAYQDRYTALKIKYGKSLADNWVEVTDPGKHVFEDIGIAAFLIELWKTMYRPPGSTALHDDEDVHDLPPFPGFVDIGCGNGILTYILLSEGYHGSGFDARRRKTWATFPQSIQSKLEQRLFVPSMFLEAVSKDEQNGVYHPGIFVEGTFFVSNHADELTAWTPLLAYLNNGSFLALPCCSHDLSGARFRAPPAVKRAKSSKLNNHDEHVRLPQQITNAHPPDDEHVRDEVGSLSSLQARQSAETGSLKRTLVQKKMASAYSTLCSYVESLAQAADFTIKKEVLRIPSTRNHSIIGIASQNDDSDEHRQQKVLDLVEEELGKSIDVVAKEWIERAEKLAAKPGSGH